MAESPVEVFQTKVTLVVLTTGRTAREAREVLLTRQIQAYGGGALIAEEDFGRTVRSPYGIAPEEVDS